MAERRLKVWVAAGLIDTATAARIDAWEAAHSRPVAQWALIGIAALSIGLGLLLLVAANWQAISPTLRLALHLGVLVATGAVLLWYGAFAASPAGDDILTHERRAVGIEAMAFVYAVLGLGFLAHLSQAYQVNAPLWQMLGPWLVLFAPILLRVGRGWLTAMALVAAACFCVGDVAALTDLATASVGWGCLIGAVCALPVVLTGAGGLERLGVGAELALRLDQIAISVGLMVASGVVLLGGFSDMARHDPQGAVLAAFITCALACIGARAAVAVAGDRHDARWLPVALAAAGGGGVVLAYLVAGHGIAAALVFIAQWVCIGIAGLRSGRNGLFRLAVGLIAMRLIVLGLEETSNLLGSGLGFIAAGAAILAIGRASVAAARFFEARMRRTAA